MHLFTPEKEVTGLEIPKFKACNACACAGEIKDAKIAPDLELVMDQVVGIGLGEDPSNPALDERLRALAQQQGSVWEPGSPDSDAQPPQPPAAPALQVRPLPPARMHASCHHTLGHVSRHSWHCGNSVLGLGAGLLHSNCGNVPGCRIKAAWKRARYLSSCEYEGMYEYSTCVY